MAVPVEEEAESVEWVLAVEELGAAVELEAAEEEEDGEAVLVESMAN